jgi:hypothetical protein
MNGAHVDVVSATEHLERPAVAAQVVNDRGDVPGWVLITLMTAGLVLIIWGVAGPALTDVFEQAIERVTSF